MKSNILIIGGTSGLGLDLAKFLAKDNQVFITGRKAPDSKDIIFIELELASDNLEEKLDKMFSELPNIDLLVYAAGFFQEGTIDQLTDEDIHKMNRVGLLAPALILQRILKKQQKLSEFIAITSTSQWTPRLLEPMYTAVKGGLGMLAASISLDERVGKVLVAGPGGMKTKFWDNTSQNTSTMLDSEWAAEQIMILNKENFKYKFAKILREPARVEVMEMRV